MPDIFLRAGEANPNDVKLRDPTLADATTSTISSIAVTQAAATISGTLAERFIFTTAVSQVAASLSATLREDFILSAITVTQAPAVIAATALQRFTISSIAVTQAAATIAATLTGGTESATVGSRMGRKWPLPLITPTALAVSVTQAPARVAASIAINDDELVLLLVA